VDSVCISERKKKLLSFLSLPSFTKLIKRRPYIDFPGAMAVQYRHGLCHVQELLPNTTRTQSDYS